MTQIPPLSFNSSSKQFLLNWSYVNGSSSGQKDPVYSVLSDRGNKFLDKQSHQISKKIGSPEVIVKTPLLSPRITRNERQRSTFYIGQNDQKYRSTFNSPQASTQQWRKAGQKHQESKIDKANKKKQQISKLEDEKWSRLKRKLLQRQPFRF